MAHTPGPWTVSKCDDGLLMIHTDGDIICVEEPNAKGGDRNFPVIAAVPDLLAAALPFAAHDWCDAELEDDNCKLANGSGNITVGHWRALRAAIAKTMPPEPVTQYSVSDATFGLYGPYDTLGEARKKTENLNDWIISETATGLVVDCADKARATKPIRSMIDPDSDTGIEF